MPARHLPAHIAPSPRTCGIAVAALALSAAAVAGCGSSGASKTASSGSSTTAGAAVPRGSGPVDVLYAGSLASVMTKQVGPAFDKATGYTFTGTSGDSKALATMIKGKTTTGDVFISASPTVNADLEGQANGNWVSWYATFASSPLVVGYNPHGAHAADFTSGKPWYQILATPGLKVGRTDPATDPKGKLTVEALDQAATADHEPALSTLATTTGNVYQENALVGDLQAGQVDAGFFYAAEAKAVGIPTIPLTGTDLKATYTLTVLNMAPHQAAADAFIDYLLGSQGAAPLTEDGFDLLKPPTVSDPAAVPAALKTTLGS